MLKKDIVNFVQESVIGNLLKVKLLGIKDYQHLGQGIIHRLLRRVIYRSTQVKSVKKCEGKNIGIGKGAKNKDLLLGLSIKIGVRKYLKEITILASSVKKEGDIWKQTILSYGQNAKVSGIL